MPARPAKLMPLSKKHSRSGLSMDDQGRGKLGQLAALISRKRSRTFDVIDLSTEAKDNHKSRRSANAKHHVMLDPTLLTPLTSLGNVPGAGTTDIFALDDPAGRVLHKNRRSTEDREQKERREELMSVLDRVNDIYGEFDNSAQTYSSMKLPAGIINVNADREVAKQKEIDENSTTEYLNTVEDLEDLLKDSLRKKQYQKQVTLFVVGFDEKCCQRVRMIRQVNEFFSDHQNWPDDDLRRNSITEDIELEKVTTSIDESIQMASSLTERLGELNKEMVFQLSNTNNNKMSNKSHKKLQKSFDRAKEEILGLNDQLIQLQSEVDDKDKRIQAIATQLEIKSTDLLKYKAAVEVAKRNNDELVTLREYASERDKEIRNLKLQVIEGKNDVKKEKHNKKISDMRNEYEKKLIESELKSEEQRIENKKQSEIVSANNESKINEMKSTHEKEIKIVKTTSDTDTSKARPQKRPYLQKHSSKLLGEKKTKTFTKKAPVKRESTLSRKDTKLEKEDVKESIIEKVVEGGSSSEESEIPIPRKIIELDDEKEWANIPMDESFGRFSEYRKRSQLLVKEKQTQYDSAVAKSQRKIAMLKAQFLEHKEKWLQERSILLEQVDQVFTLHDGAEQDALEALGHLERIIEYEEHRIEEGVYDEVEDEQVVNDDMPVVEPREVGEDAGINNADEAEKQINDSTPIIVQSTSQFPLPANKDDYITVESLQIKSSMQPDQLSPSDAQDRVDQRKAIERMRNSSMDRKRVKSATVESVRSIADSWYDADIQELGDSDIDANVHQTDTVPIKILQPSHPVYSSDYIDTATSPVSFLLKKETEVNREMKNFNQVLIEDCISIYKTIMTFKGELGQLFLNKDMMSASAVLADIDCVNLDEEEHPNTDTLNLIKTSIKDTISKSIKLVEEALNFEREYPVSSLRHHLSRDASLANMNQIQNSVVDVNTPQPTALSPVGSARSARRINSSVSMGKPRDSVPNSGITKTTLTQDTPIDQGENDKTDWQHEYILSKQHYDSQLNHNNMMMLEMQDSITTLQNEIQALKSEAENARNLKTKVESSIMFTRLDSERNAKIMKKAVVDNKMEYEDYKKILGSMDEYISLPAQRLAYLVRKYVHHRRMQSIENNVRSVNGGVSDQICNVLGKMEGLQSKRARKWENKMDDISNRRNELANDLTETMSEIESQSGIFLIKPMFSYKSFNTSTSYGKANNRQGNRWNPGSAAMREASYRDIGSKLSNINKMNHVSKTPNTVRVSQEKEFLKKLEESNQMVNNSKNSWVPMQSQSVNTIDNIVINTPKMIELDINRMLISHNKISASLSDGINNYISLKRNVSSEHSKLHLPPVTPSGSTVYCKSASPLKSG